MRALGPHPNPRRPRLICGALALGIAAFVPIAAAQTHDQPAIEASTTSSVKAAAVNALASAEHLSTFALGLIGVHYRWGGTNPDTGLDCSGLVRYVFAQITGVDLPHNAKEMSRVGDHVRVADLMPGDLVYFNTRRFAFSHVGIYLGDNRFLHAPSAGREVEIATLDKSYWHKHFSGARRLIGVLPGLIPALVSEAVAAPTITSESAPLSPGTAESAHLLSAEAILP